MNMDLPWWPRPGRWPPWPSTQPPASAAHPPPRWTHGTARAPAEARPWPARAAAASVGPRHAAVCREREGEREGGRERGREREGGRDRGWESTETEKERERQRKREEAGRCECESRGKEWKQCLVLDPDCFLKTNDVCDDLIGNSERDRRSQYLCGLCEFGLGRMRCDRQSRRCEARVQHELIVVVIRLLLIVQTRGRGRGRDC